MLLYDFLNRELWIWLWSFGVIVGCGFGIIFWVTVGCEFF